MAIYFGSESSDALDTYDMGNWTPSINPGFTVGYNTQIGRYTKIGDLVYFTCYIGTNSISGSSSATNAQIHGLPFTSKALSSFNGFDISVSWIYQMGESVTKGYVNQSTNYIQLLKAPTGGSRNHANANGTWDKNSLYIMCAGVYPTAFE